MSKFYRIQWCSVGLKGHSKRCEIPSKMFSVARHKLVRAIPSDQVGISVQACRWTQSQVLQWKMCTHLLVVNSSCKKKLQKHDIWHLDIMTMKKLGTKNMLKLKLKRILWENISKCAIIRSRIPFWVFCLEEQVYCSIISNIHVANYLFLLPVRPD